MGHYLYKGLKKPLVFFGLKDKYIYYALGSALTGVISLAVLPSFMGFIGALIGAGIGGGGVWYTFHMQTHKGLYNKQKNKDELHIFPKRMEKEKKEFLKELTSLRDLLLQTKTQMEIFYLKRENLFKSISEEQAKDFLQDEESKKIVNEIEENGLQIEQILYNTYNS